MNNQFSEHKELTEQHNRISGEHNQIWADRSPLKSCLCQVEVIRFYSGYYRLFFLQRKKITGPFDIKGLKMSALRVHCGLFIFNVTRTTEIYANRHHSSKMTPLWRVLQDSLRFEGCTLHVCETRKFPFHCLYACFHCHCLFVFDLFVYNK